MIVVPAYKTALFTKESFQIDTVWDEKTQTSYKLRRFNCKGAELSNEDEGVIAWIELQDCEDSEPKIGINANSSLEIDSCGWLVWFNGNEHNFSFHKTVPIELVSKF